MGVTSKQKIYNLYWKSYVIQIQQTGVLGEFGDQTVNSKVTDNCLNCVFNVQEIIFHSLLSYVSL